MRNQAEANLSALIESTEDLIWSVDLDYRLIVCNAAFERHFWELFGVRVEAGMRLQDMVPPERASRFRPLFERALAHGPFRAEYPLVNGRTTELAFNPIVVDGKAVGVSVFGKDITERKAAERALKDAEGKYQAIFDGALEGMLQTTTEGRILKANPALARMLGYDSPEDLLFAAKDTTRDLWVEPLDRSRFVGLLDEHGIVTGFECRMKRRDGSFIWVSTTCRKVLADHGTSFVFDGMIEDITERRLAEELLRESGDFLREAQRIGDMGCYVWDFPKGVWTSTDVLDGIFGIDKKYERTAAGAAALLHPDELAAMDAYFAEDVVGKRQLFDREYRIVRQNDHAERWVQGMGKLEFDPQGRPLKMRGIIRDITEHKRAEMQLRESEERYRAFFEQAAVGILHTSLEGRILSSNECFARIAGYTRDELVGMTFQQITAPDDVDESVGVFDRLLSGTVREASWEKRYIRKDGSLTWVKAKVSTQRDGQGRTLYFITIVEDINVRKAAEEQLAKAQQDLRTSEERYRTAFQTSLDAVNINRLSDGAYLDCNKAFLDIVGFELHEVLGRSSLELDFWADPGDRLRLLDELRRNSVCRDLVAQFRRKDGTLVWGQMSASIIEIDGVPCVLSVARDISAAKATEQRLAAAMEALRLSEAHYRTVFQTSVDGFAISQMRDGKYIDVNPAFLDLMGFEREEIIGRTSLELNFWVDPEVRDEVVATLREHSLFRDVETQFVRKNGETIWLQLSGTAMEIEGVPCILSVLRDISADKAAEQRLATAQEALRASEERYRATFQMSIDAININRLTDGAFVDVNEAFLKFVGFEREEVIGRTSRELDFWVDPEVRQQMVETLRLGSSCSDLKAQFRRKNGEIVWGQASESIIQVDGVPCILSVTRDISAAKAADERLATAAEALRVSEARYRNVFQTSLDSITLSRFSDGRFTDVNQAFLDLMGFNYGEIIGPTSEELGLWADGGTREGLADMLKRDSSFRDVTIRLRKKSGEIFWALLSASLIELDGVSHVLCVMRDVSAAKAAEERIKDLAFYDPLTHLPNRRLLLERLRLSLAASARTSRKRALLFVDLDNFKTLNDTLGHQTGDLMLQEVAQRLATCVREADTVARLGGDEFVVMLEDLSDVAEDAAAQAEVIGEKILAAVEQPFWLAGRECPNSCSIGVTVFGNNRESTDDVLQQADIAMYQAKAAGRNAMRFFAPALQAAVNARAALEEDIRQAIKGDQFILYYQPQLDSLGLIGAEALIRWNHPRRGLLAPGEFIPLAEETGLILPLGDWVLETACAQIAAWGDRPETAHISLAVNISARQFRDPGFVDKVLATLERSGANPHNVKLELTESMLVENIEDVIVKMSELKSHGLGFSLDDFGTGYSSLSYLKLLPLDQLKIDSSFVRDILSDVGSRAIAQSVISLGRALGLSVIAECVEIEEQRVLLSRLGCTAFQGYLFSRPLPLEEFERLWLRPAGQAVSVSQ